MQGPRDTSIIGSAPSPLTARLPSMRPVTSLGVAMTEEDIADIVAAFERGTPDATSIGFDSATVSPAACGASCQPELSTAAFATVVTISDEASYALSLTTSDPRKKAVAVILVGASENLNQIASHV